MTKGKLNIPTKQTIPERRQVPQGAPMGLKGNLLHQAIKIIRLYLIQENNLAL